MADSGGMDGVQLSFSRAEDFVLVTKPKTAVAFVEARLKDGVAKTHRDAGYRQLLGKLERELSPPQLSDDTVIELQADLLKDPQFAALPQNVFRSVRVVEFQGLNPTARIVSAGEVAIKVHLYGLSDDRDDGRDVLELPAAGLDGIWELLVLDDPTRTTLSRTATNFVPFLENLGPDEVARARPDRMMLIHGPPGSGKTTVAKAFAQKLAVRGRSQRFPTARLIRFEWRDLLKGPVGGMMARFRDLGGMLSQHSSTFHVILFDNVETLASAMDLSGGDQTLARVPSPWTSIFLDQLDVLRRTADNFLAVCTSRDKCILDQSFVNRCGLVLELGLPDVCCRYQMLQQQLEALMASSIIMTEEMIPRWLNASIEDVLKEDTVGARLVRVSRLLELVPEPLRCTQSLSGLVSRVLVANMLGESCSLDQAFEALEEFAKRSSENKGRKRSYQELSSSEVDGSESSEHPSKVVICFDEGKGGGELENGTWHDIVEGS